MEQLRARFFEAVHDAIRQCNDFGYRPTKLEAMLRTQHAVEASIKLVGSSDIQDGLKRLAKENRSELALEYIMLRPEFAPLFKPALLEVAKWRLRQAHSAVGLNAPELP